VTLVFCVWVVLKDPSLIISHCFPKGPVLPAIFLKDINLIFHLLLAVEIFFGTILTQDFIHILMFGENQSVLVKTSPFLHS